ncbi:RluA family pseudouridine synthase [Gloeocapsa sp. PCC 73106]|uniref:RluA family pseudouridine synthase n=1 Tax=Gloeocapsa sp. PCC 73106 TaxID=102232 RepID=UPI0002ABB0C1|nr:RluA family pseudouridine synthase [Gloeocapsa sp. PCC 73106]ELR99154.1 pseudouridine synthase, RluA family [Gloeocapsa sp. PCC 73106]
MQIERELDLQVDNQGDRLDRWLTEQLSDYSRARVQRLIDQGLVLVNGQIVTEKKTKLKIGDRLHLTIPKAVPLELQPEAIALDILYEDDFLLIINKPAGLVVHPAPGHDSGTVVNALLHHCPDLPGIGEVKRPGIVHRLDKNTTGAMVVAKTDLAYQHLQAQIQAKTAQREYIGIVHGAPSQPQGIIDLPIGRNLTDHQKMAVVPQEKGGRQARTTWKILERLSNYTLMHFQLSTGRTHQIRVHSSYLGHPLVGDPIYSSNHSLGVKLHGQALHALELTLTHPVSGELITAIAPPPEEFQKLLTILRQRQ